MVIANKMIINANKPKDMVISFHEQPIDIPPITLCLEIKRVKSVKLVCRFVNYKVLLGKKIQPTSASATSDYAIQNSCAELGLTFSTCSRSTSQ